jgi:hypothetical protein
VIRHGVEAGFGQGTIIYHSLNHDGPPFSERRVQVHQLFDDLQRPNVFITGLDNPLRRYIANPKEAKRMSSTRAYCDSLTRSQMLNGICHNSTRCYLDQNRFLLLKVYRLDDRSHGVKSINGS